MQVFTPYNQHIVFKYSTLYSTYHGTCMFATRDIHRVSHAAGLGIHFIELPDVRMDSNDENDGKPSVFKLMNKSKGAVEHALRTLLSDSFQHSRLYYFLFICFISLTHAPPSNNGSGDERFKHTYSVFFA